MGEGQRSQVKFKEQSLVTLATISLFTSLTGPFQVILNFIFQPKPLLDFWALPVSGPPTESIELYGPYSETQILAGLKRAHRPLSSFWLVQYQKPLCLSI